MGRKSIVSDIAIKPIAELGAKLKQADCPWWIRLPGKYPDTKDENDIEF